MHPQAGGPPVVAHQWCKQLTRAGHDATILSTNAFVPADDDGSWFQALQSDTNAEIFPSIGPSGFGYSPSLKHRCRELLAATDRTKIDLVHLHNLWSYSNRFLTRYLDRARVPFVVSTHGMLDPNSLTRKAWKKRVYGRFCEWPVLRKASAMLYTHPEEERLANLMVRGLPKGKIVPLGAQQSSQDRETLRATFATKYPELRERKIAIFLGRLHEKKGPDLLLKGLALMTTEQRPHLLMVGPGDDDYRRHLEQVASRLGLQSDVTFTGPLSGIEKETVLAGSDVFVLPSHQENFALTVVESLFAGTPVILSDRVNLWEDLTREGAGIRCERAPESIANCLERVLGSETQQASLRQNGLRLAESRFTWEKSADALVSAYEQVLA